MNQAAFRIKRSDLTIKIKNANLFLDLHFIQNKCRNFMLQQLLCLRDTNLHYVCLQIEAFAMRKIPKFYLSYRCGNFVETYSFHRVSSDSLCVSIKFRHQEVKGEISLFYAVMIHAFGITSLTGRHPIND